MLIVLRGRLKDTENSPHEQEWRCQDAAEKNLCICQSNACFTTLFSLLAYLPTARKEFRPPQPKIDLYADETAQYNTEEYISDERKETSEGR